MMISGAGREFIIKDTHRGSRRSHQNLVSVFVEALPQ
ncbi:hypothetical protein TBK1r_41800 [Stieleria magnilauensis]|uniref:Uncharacterized protein n=1 Tax=Stieleria magnilauensis TaxID=2527963 RepID=A0ABX5XT84_9BACT|nr:hypothetical protein TBK1r_41800 [Planctomycetes bacterium TBK1r]